MPHSKALEVNLQNSRVEVVPDPKYGVLQEIVAGYHGILESLGNFLKEVCHPYKNWQYIVTEGRRFALHHFHLFKSHPKGPEGARLIAEIFFQAVSLAAKKQTKADAVDNLLVYLGLIIEEAGNDLPRFLDMIDDCFEWLYTMDDDDFTLVLQSFYQVGDTVSALEKSATGKTDFSAANMLLHSYLGETFGYWLREPDPLSWFIEAGSLETIPRDMAELFAPISHQTLQAHRKTLVIERRNESVDSRQTLKKLVQLPGFRDIVNHYERMASTISRSGREMSRENLLIFLFHIMNVVGLSSIHERALRDINRTMTQLIADRDPEDVQILVNKTFKILKNCARQYPQTAFNAILGMGKAVYRTHNDDLVEAFVALVIDLGFQTPDVKGVGDNWQVRANTAHIENIRLWINLIVLHPRWSTKLISALVANLAFYGVFIKDTDLFPRDVTHLLNAEIKPVYNLVKQLCRLFPVYFNEIGAEGSLRDISTQIDEASHRRDALVHYLRKQSHVESSPQTVILMEAIFQFWRTRDQEPLRNLIPPDIYEAVQPEGPYVMGMHLLVNRLHDRGVITNVRDLLSLSPEDLTAALDGDQPGVDRRDRQRLEAACQLYQILNRKYFTDRVDLEQYINQLPTEAVPDLPALKRTLSRAGPKDKLEGLLDYMETLRDVILSEERFEIREDIFYKRHIAVDIPSMYGSYHEKKFDALGLTFRLESLVSTLLQQVIDDLDLTLITRATLNEILQCLRLFDRALNLDGLYSQEFERQIDMLSHSLKIRGFSFTQFMDIFRGFSQVVNHIVNDHFNNTHQNQVVKILSQNPHFSLASKFKKTEENGNEAEFLHRATEIFLRDRIAASPGLQQLDILISRILNTVFHQDHELSPEHLRTLLDYDPTRAFTEFSPVEEEIKDIINLGAKGYNLVKITELGLPVPKGFIITTEVFRCREVNDRFPPAKELFQGLLARQIQRLEGLTGKKFGHPGNPLLLSVRSGSTISQPGMMDTYLNVGLNEHIVESMAGNANNRQWFAWDCYRRFLQNYGMARGRVRDEFDLLMADYKNRVGLAYKRDFSGAQMREVARQYKDYLRGHHIEIEERPFEQLYLAINGVFQSWNALRAEEYRKIMSISNDWGTAVTVQAMVYGNLSQQAGAGVYFTHNPRWSGDKMMLWGDFALGNQGEDVVSGLVETLPVSREQAEIEGRQDQATLEAHFPKIYDQLADIADNMINHWGFGPQEIEFTFESPHKDDLFVLQTRDLSLRERPQVTSFDLVDGREIISLGHGIGVSGGGISGRIVFTVDDIEKWRTEEPETPLILVRGDTVPDDIREIYESDGLLTARGGSTSHAAIVAHRLNKTCIVGCAELIVNQAEKRCRMGDITLQAGDWISMDGLEGAVYNGRLSETRRPTERGGF